MTGDDRRPGRRDRRGAPPRPGKRPTGARPDSEKPSEPRAGKPLRVRKDGSVASGAREARAERAGDPPSAKTRPSRTGRSDGTPRSGAADWGPRPPHADASPKTRTGAGAARPARAGNAPASGRSTRAEDGTASGRRAGTAPASGAREARPGHAGDPPTGKARPSRAGSRDEVPRSAAADRGPRPPRAEASARTRAGSGAPRGATAHNASAPSRPSRTGAASRARAEDGPANGKRAGDAPVSARTLRARPAPRTRADGSVATRRPPASSRGEPQRIAKLLARAGIASRREIERMIAEGRIAIDGVALDTPATVLTSLAGVTVDGRAVAAPEAARLFLFHKPAGFLTTERDPRGRPTIYDRLPADMPRVVPVGRLDMNTEGLLLLTTDGGLKRQLELPATGVPRVYRARAYGEVSQDQLEALIEGVEIDGVRYGQIDANLERRTGRNVWIEMVLTEGKNREVRRVLEYLGLQVSRLIRVAYGPFLLGELPAGGVGEVKQHELVEFRKTLKG